MIAGLCSVTFRHLPAAEVVGITSAAGLSTIEWGGDVHVPHGDVAAAEAAARLTAEAGLSVASYGSYLFCDDSGVPAAAAVCDTAEALGTRLVRVWCPWGVGPDAPKDDRAAAARSLERIAGAMAERGIEAYLEFHDSTLTATAASAVALLDEVGAPNLRCAWQPPYWSPVPVDHEVADIAALADRLGHLHVYAWSPDGSRHPLSGEADRWPARLGAAAAAAPMEVAPRAALLEFVADDDADQLAVDAATLLEWLA